MIVASSPRSTTSSDFDVEAAIQRDLEQDLAALSEPGTDEDFPSDWDGWGTTRPAWPPALDEDRSTTGTAVHETLLNPRCQTLNPRRQTLGGTVPAQTADFAPSLLRDAYQQQTAGPGTAVHGTGPRTDAKQSAGAAPPAAQTLDFASLLRDAFGADESFLPTAQGQAQESLDRVEAVVEEIHKTVVEDDERSFLAAAPMTGEKEDARAKEERLLQKAAEQFDMNQDELAEYRAAFYGGEEEGSGEEGDGSGHCRRYDESGTVGGQSGVCGSLHGDATGAELFETSGAVPDEIDQPLSSERPGATSPGKRRSPQKSSSFAQRTKAAASLLWKPISPLKPSSPVKLRSGCAKALSSGGALTEGRHHARATGAREHLLHSDPALSQQAQLFRSFGPQTTTAASSSVAQSISPKKSSEISAIEREEDRRRSIELDAAEKKARLRAMTVQRIQRAEQAMTAQREMEEQRYNQYGMLSADADSRMHDFCMKEQLGQERDAMRLEDDLGERLREFERDEAKRAEQLALDRERRNMRREERQRRAEMDAVVAEREMGFMAREDARSTAWRSVVREWEGMSAADGESFEMRDNSRRVEIEWPGMAENDCDVRSGGEAMAGGPGFWWGAGFWMLLGRENRKNRSGREEDAGWSEEAAYSPKSCSSHGSVEEYLGECCGGGEKKSSMCDSLLKTWFRRAFLRRPFPLKEKLAQAVGRLTRAAVHHLLGEPRPPLLPRHDEPPAKKNTAKISACQLPVLPISERTNIHVKLSELARYRSLCVLDLSNRGLVSQDICRQISSSCLLLEHLSLRNNQLSSLGGVERLLNLETFDVSDNLVADVQFLTRGCLRLVELNLARNRVSRLPESTNVKLRLRKLCLCENKLEKFLSQSSTILRDCERLQCLDLANNKLEKFPADVLSRAMPLLEELLLSGNSLGVVREMSFPLLRKLSLDGNELGNMEGLGFLPSLEQLNVAGNQIGDLPLDFCVAPNLRELDASGNQIGSLRRNVFCNFPKLEHLSLHNNVGDLRKSTTRYRRHVVRATRECLRLLDGQEFHLREDERYYRRELGGDGANALLWHDETVTPCSSCEFFELADRFSAERKSLVIGCEALVRSGTAGGGSDDSFCDLYALERKQEVENMKDFVRWRHFRLLYDFLQDKVVERNAAARIEFSDPVERGKLFDIGSSTSSSSSTLGGVFRFSRERPATTIQSHWRGCVARAFSHNLRAAERRAFYEAHLPSIIRVQTRVRGFLAHQARRRHHSANRLQNAARRFLLLRRLRRLVVTARLDFDLDLLMPEVDVGEFCYDEGRYENPFDAISKTLAAAREKTDNLVSALDSAAQNIEDMLVVDIEEEEGAIEVGEGETRNPSREDRGERGASALAGAGEVAPRFSDFPVLECSGAEDCGKKAEGTREVVCDREATPRRGEERQEDAGLTSMAHAANLDSAAAGGHNVVGASFTGMTPPLGFELHPSMAVRSPLPPATVHVDPDLEDLGFDPRPVDAPFPPPPLPEMRNSAPRLPPLPLVPVPRAVAPTLPESGRSVSSSVCSNQVFLRPLEETDFALRKGKLKVSGAATTSTRGRRTVMNLPAHDLGMGLPQTEIPAGRCSVDCSGSVGPASVAHAASPPSFPVVQPPSQQRPANRGRTFSGVRAPDDHCTEVTPPRTNAVATSSSSSGAKLSYGGSSAAARGGVGAILPQSEDERFITHSGAASLVQQQQDTPSLRTECLGSSYAGSPAWSRPSTAASGAASAAATARAESAARAEQARRQQEAAAAQAREAAARRKEATLQRVAEEWGFADLATAESFLQSQRRKKGKKAGSTVPGCGPPAAAARSRVDSGMSEGSRGGALGRSPISVRSSHSTRSQVSRPEPSARESGQSRRRVPVQAWQPNSRKVAGPNAQDAIRAFKLQQAREAAAARAAVEGNEGRLPDL